MIRERIQVRNSILVQRSLWEHDVCTKEHTIDEDAALTWGVAAEANHLYVDSVDHHGPNGKRSIHRTRFGQEKPPSQTIERIGTAIEKRRLQQWIAQHGILHRRSEDTSASTLHSERISAEMVGMPMSRHDSGHVSVELSRDGAQCLPHRSVVQTGVDEDDVAIIDSNDSDVHTSRDVADARRQLDVL